MEFEIGIIFVGGDSEFTEGEGGLFAGDGVGEGTPLGDGVDVFTLRKMRVSRSMSRGLGGKLTASPPVRFPSLD